MASTVSDESRLLALPMELLVRTTDFLGDDSLPTLRLTCKTLDAAVFDRFAQCNVFELRCCALFKERWMRIRNILTRAPRLRAKVNWVTITFDALEGRDSRSISLAPDQNNHDFPVFAQRSAAEALCPAGQQVLDETRANKALMVSVLNHISTTNIGLDVNLVGLSPGDSVRGPVHRDLLVAIADTGSLLDYFSMSPASCSGLEDLSEIQKENIFDAASTAGHVSFRSGPETNGRTQRYHADNCLLISDAEVYRFAKMCIQRATEMRSFALNLDFRRGSGRAAVVLDFLLAGTFAALEALSLCNAEISGDALLGVLSQCEHTLTDFRTTQLYLQGESSSWGRIFSKCASMQHLASASSTRPAGTSLRDLSKTWNSSRTFCSAPEDSIFSGYILENL